MCFQAAIANESNMLLLIPEKEIDINEELEASISQLLSESESQMKTGIEWGYPVVLGRASILKTLYLSPTKFNPLPTTVRRKLEVLPTLLPTALLNVNCHLFTRVFSVFLPLDSSMRAPTLVIPTL